MLVVVGGSVLVLVVEVVGAAVEVVDGTEAPPPSGLTDGVAQADTARRRTTIDGTRM